MEGERRLGGLPVKKAECDGLSQLRMERRAGEAPGFPATRVYEGGCSGKRRVEVPDKSTKMAIDSSDAMDARDDLLADVATFVKINRDSIEPDFLRQRVLGELAAPARETTFNPQ